MRCRSSRGDFFAEKLLLDLFEPFWQTHKGPKAALNCHCLKKLPTKVPQQTTVLGFGVMGMEWADVTFSIVWIWFIRQNTFSYAICICICHMHMPYAYATCICHMPTGFPYAFGSLFNGNMGFPCLSMLFNGNLCFPDAFCCCSMEILIFLRFCFAIFQ